MSAPTYRRHIADHDFFVNQIRAGKEVYTQTFKELPTAILRPGTYVAVCEPFAQDPQTGELMYKWDCDDFNSTYWLSGSSMGIRYARYFIYVKSLTHTYDDRMKLHVVTFKIAIKHRDELDLTQICVGQ